MALKEIRGDLFSTSISQLAHCVSADLEMGAGIAVQFKQRYGRVEELRAQEQGIGGVAVLYKGEQTVYYLVTKDRYFQKPTLTTMQRSLEKLRDIMLSSEQYELAIPMIGCGLDRLQWSQVWQLLTEILVGSGISVTVYKL